MAVSLMLLAGSVGARLPIVSTASPAAAAALVLFVLPTTMGAEACDCKDARTDAAIAEREMAGLDPNSVLYDHYKTQLEEAQEYLNSSSCKEG